MIDYKKTALKLLGLVAISILILVGIGLGLFFWPFTIAIITSIILERIIEYIVRKTKISRKIVGSFFVILIYSLIVFLIYLLLSRLIKEAFSIADDLPTIFEYIKSKYQIIYEKYISAMKNIPGGVTKKIYEIGIDFLGNLSKYVTKLFNASINFIMFIPNIFIYTFVTLLATIFLVTDKRKISMYIHDIFPKKIVRKVSNIFREIVTSLTQYLKSQLIMICITFVELLIAFFVLKQDYPFTLAFCIALIDALPILGAGGILIPWGIYSSIVGNIYLGIGLIIAYVITIIVRQFIEPKIVSSNLGVHPFVTLISMYIGFKILGVFGFIAGPIVMVIFKNVFAQLFENGCLKGIVVYKNIKQQ